jgi:TRAP-type mannitol/chloroaromatic compound transport system permease small subunit
VLVFTLNLLGGACAGYFVLGQRGKAVVALAGFLFLLYPTCGIVSLLLALATAIDVYKQARVSQAGRRIGNWTFLDQYV